MEQTKTKMIIDDFFFDKKFTPEQSLVSAVISRAWGDLTSADLNIQHKAFKWICSDEFESWSFSWCCQQIELDFVYVRKFIFDNPEIIKKYIGRNKEKASFYNHEHKKKAASKTYEAYIKATISDQENEFALMMH
jgi:hypothetical protein